VRAQQQRAGRAGDRIDGMDRIDLAGYSAALAWPSAIVEELAGMLR
jgi:hypothetical protein